MAGKRVEKTGRFASRRAATEGDPKPAGAADEAEKPGEAKKKAPRPAFCRVYARARVAEAMPGLVKTLLDEAGKGSLAHLKVLVQLSGLDTGEVVPQKGRRRGKSLETVLKERWEQDRLEREADRAERDGVRQDGTTDGDRRMDEG